MNKQTSDELKFVYVVIGGPPQYHLEDDEIREIYGIYTTRKQAEQTCNVFKDGCGHLYLLEVPLDRSPSDFGDSLRISSFEDRVPEQGYKVERGEEFGELYFVLYEKRKGGGILYKVCSKEEDARAAKKTLDSLDESSSGFWGECRVRKYWFRDLPKWNFDETIVDKEVEKPIEYDRLPMWYSRV